MREKIHAFIRTNFLFDETRTVGDDEPLLGSGIIDSTGILELITYIEQEFALSFEDAELVGENFNTVSSIIACIERKRKGSA